MLKQGALEASNTDMAQAMTEMIEAQRTYQLTSKAIQTADSDDGDRQRGQAMSLGRRSRRLAARPTSAPPAPQASKDFKAALGFEQMLVGQLVKEMAPKDGPLAEGPYASTMQDTLTTALVGGQGLGLARQLYKEMQSS